MAPPPVTTLKTPAGSPASAQISAKSRAEATTLTKRASESAARAAAAALEAEEAITAAEKAMTAAEKAKRLAAVAKKKAAADKRKAEVDKRLVDAEKKKFKKKALDVAADEVEFAALKEDFDKKFFKVTPNLISEYLHWQTFHLKARL